MIIPKTFIFFAVTCVTTAASAASTTSTNFVSAASLNKILDSGNGNFIIQLNKTTCIKHFVPRFLDGAIQVFGESIGKDKIEKRNGNRIVRRDTDTDQVHVFDAYDIGSSFKAITVKFENLNIVHSLLTSFTGEVVKIIPDQDIMFDLPTTRNKKKNSLRRRYYMRSKQDPPPAARQGNFNFDSYKHDPDCPYADALEHDVRDAVHSITQHHNKRADVSPKKKTTKKSSTTKRKSTTTRKKTTTKKTVTTVKDIASGTCYPGSAGKKKGDGFSSYCCSSSDDCKDTCISGKCNGPVNKRTTTTRKAAATTKKAATTATKEASITATTTKKSAATTTTTTSYVKQSNTQWNLARIAEHKLDFKKPYIYDSNAGSDVYVYIIDDGLNLAHTEFGGRASWGYSAYSGISQMGEGHGTHVAGIIGSKTYGVAKKVKMIAVQVLQADGTGSISSLLAGLQWAHDDAQSKKGKAIINMSLAVQTNGDTSSSYTALDNAVTALVQSGVPLFAAAGNWQVDACQVLPGANKNVYSVAATDNTDAQAWYSDYGACVSIYAPGSEIKSTYIGSKTATTTMSGTSMAAPHVAGVAALLIGKLDSPTPANLYSQISSLSTKGIATGTGTGTVNALLFNGQKLTTN